MQTTMYDFSLQDNKWDAKIKKEVARCYNSSTLSQIFLCKNVFVYFVKTLSHGPVMLMAFILFMIVKQYFPEIIFFQNDFSECIGCIVHA